jgi:hypothetical protein
VDHHVMVVKAEQNALCEAGLAAVGFVLGVVHLARRRGLRAAARMLP